MAKTKPRDWRDNWRTSEWWDAWLWQWRWVSCAIEAKALHDARDRYYMEWERIAAPRNRLVESLNDLYARHAARTPRTPFSLAHGVDRDGYDRARAMQSEIRQLDAELVDLMNTGWRRAFDADSIEDTTLRVYLEHRGTPYAYARQADREADSSELAASSEKVTAQNLRTRLRNYCVRTIEQRERDLERMRKRVVADTERYEIDRSIRRHEDEIAWLRERLVGLTPRGH